MPYRPFFFFRNWPWSLAINLTGAEEAREGIYRKVVIVISVILSRPFGYTSLLLAVPASNSAFILLDVDGVLFPRNKISSGSTCCKSMDSDMAKKNEFVMKCQLNVYLSQALFECSMFV